MTKSNGDEISRGIYQPYQCLLKQQQLQKDRDFFGSLAAENFWHQFLFAAQIPCAKKVIIRVGTNNPRLISLLHHDQT
jgi:hypothetical protein